jgi:hypothetical protein
MGKFKLRWPSIVRVLLFSAAAFFVCRAALAQVNGFVVVNPIVVCDSNGMNCPPFGVQCNTNTNGAYTCTQSLSPSTATVNTPIGFVDGDTNTNLTRAILAAEGGIDVAFFPVQQYNSPNTNVDPWPKISPPYSTSPTNYQHLHIKSVTCKDGTVVQASPDLAALTQHQICTEHKGVPAGVSNPPLAPSPAPPLGSTLGESNALDLFFVTDFNQTVFGVSWINGDGVAIAGPPTFLVSGPRFDNLAHEIGHALALDHSTFGAGGANNLLTTGSSRFVPSSSGCSITNPLGTNKFSNPNGGVLYDLANPSVVYPCPTFPSPPNPLPTPKADQLTFGSACTALDSTCTNQKGALSLSPFINKTLASTANAGGGALAAVATSATTSTTSSSGDVQFKVKATPGTGNPEDAINSIIIAVPASGPLSFNGNSPVTFTGSGCQDNLPPLNPTPDCSVTFAGQLKLSGNNGFGNSNCMKSIGVATPSSSCVQVFFQGFTAGEFVTFTVAFNKDSGTIISQNLLAGAQYSIITGAAGYATTSLFGNAVSGVFSANSQNPDFTTPNLIQNPSAFVNASVRALGPILSKCTPPYTGSGPNQQCPGGSLPVGPD